jgi:hypothetical protein
MPRIRPRKLLKLQLSIEAREGCLCPTNGQCRHAGVSPFPANQGLDDWLEGQSSKQRFQRCRIVTPNSPHD